MVFKNVNHLNFKAVDILTWMFKTIFSRIKAPIGKYNLLRYAIHQVNFAMFSDRSKITFISVSVCFSMWGSAFRSSMHNECDSLLYVSSTHMHKRNPVLRSLTGSVQGAEPASGKRCVKGLANSPEINESPRDA